MIIQHISNINRKVGLVVGNQPRVVIIGIGGENHYSKLCFLITCVATMTKNVATTQNLSGKISHWVCLIGVGMIFEI